MHNINRREFIKKTSLLSAAAVGLNAVPSSLFSFGWQNNTEKTDLAVVEGEAVRANVRKAVDMLGGMSKFVKENNEVVVKPNMAWDRMPEQAANTNPDLIAEVVKMCFEAGAKKVKVFDRTCNNARRCYLRSGIQKAAEQEGADVSHIVNQKFKEVKIPEGEILKSWEIYKDVLDADVFINVPILKSHSISGITVGFKNLMGVLGGDRGKLHNKFDQKIVDINTVLKPQLTILDAHRILLRNGPQGGNIKDVKIAKTVVAGVDRLALDSFGAKLFGLNPVDVAYIKNAHERGLGEINLEKLVITKESLSG